VTIFVDASNIKAGGGLTHLVELLRHAVPAEAGIERIIVAAPKSTLAKIDEKPWLEKYSHALLDQTYFHRLWWSMFLLPGILDQHQAFLFIPGAGKPFFRRPYVTMCRNLLPLDYHELFRFGFSFTTLRLLTLRVLHLKAYRDAAGVIFLTRYCFDVLPEKYRKAIRHFKVIPHGINHELFKPKDWTADRDTSKDFKLLYISIVNLYKHQDKVAEAVVNLRRKGHPISLTLIGPSYPKALKKLEAIMHQDPAAVTYQGKVPYDQVAGVYQNHDAFVLASTCETFCMILTEAMAMGMPIACSAKSSLPETLDQAGIYFEPEDVTSIETAILELYKNPDLRTTLSTAALTRSKTFDWKICARDTMVFLAETAKKSVIATA